MSEATLKMVQVGGQTFLGFLEGSSLKDATQLAPSFSAPPMMPPGVPAVPVQTGVSQELNRQTASQYLIAKELGKLTSMNIGSVDTISYRDLTADELHLMEEVNYVMDRARKTAMSNVIVGEFRTLLGK
jgi:hypothetical protein